MSKRQINPETEKTFMALTLAVVADTLGIAEKLPGENRQQYRARIASIASKPYEVKKASSAIAVQSFQIAQEEYEAALMEYHNACMTLGRSLGIYAEPDERNKPEEYDLRVTGFAKTWATREINSLRGQISAKWLANNSEPVAPPTPTKTALRLAARVAATIIN
jgi:hypothetical protein